MCKNEHWRKRFKESPEYCHERLRELRKRNKYAQDWQARVVTKTNRHPESDGALWGWYEIWPVEITVGFWRRGNEIPDADIEAFNHRLTELDKND